MNEPRSHHHANPRPLESLAAASNANCRPLHDSDSAKVAGHSGIRDSSLDCAEDGPISGNEGGIFSSLPQSQEQQIRTGAASDSFSTMASAPSQRRILHKDRFAYVFGSLKTQTYHDPAARGPGSHTYVSQTSEGNCCYLLELELQERKRKGKSRANR
jgi:hypothetical protein